MDSKRKISLAALARQQQSVVMIDLCRGSLRDLAARVPVASSRALSIVERHVSIVPAKDPPQTVRTKVSLFGECLGSRQRPPNRPRLLEQLPQLVRATSGLWQRCGTNLVHIVPFDFAAPSPDDGRNKKSLCRNDSIRGANSRR